ncbi:MAG: hypothetical protein ACKOYM_05085, partial [Actinomycetes bacterium]
MFGLAALVAALTGLVIGIPNAGASRADIAAVDFRAAAPLSYNHATGGGGWNAGVVGKANNVVGSLEGSDFRCNDIVTHLVKVSVAAHPVDAQQSVRVALTYSTDATGQSGVALVPFTSASHLKVNAGDTAMIGDGGSTITNAVVSTNGKPSYTPGATATVTFDVTDLEAGETVVVRSDTQIGCQSASSATGNLQSTLTSVAVISPGTPGSVSAGNQTVNFQQVGNIAGTGEASLTLNKTVTSASGACPGTTSGSLDLAVATSARWCVTVANVGTYTAFNVAVTDDMTTPATNGDDTSLSPSPMSDIAGDGTPNDLGAGASASTSFTMSFSGTGTYTNTASASATDNGSTTYSATAQAALVVSGAIPTTTPPHLHLLSSPGGAHAEQAAGS